MAQGIEATVDLLVVGTGAAGLAAAVTGASLGLDVLVVEKADRFGGTTALSGGVMWIPNNHLMAQEGLSDSAEDALTYLTTHIGNRVGPARLKAFVRHAPEMLRRFADQGFVQVSPFASFPDYSAETPGGVKGGRSVEPAVFPMSRLGEHAGELRARRRSVAPGGIVGNMVELRQLAAIRSNPVTAMKAWRVLLRLVRSRLTGERYVAQGAALVAWLRAALLEKDVPVWLESPLASLLRENGRVAGAVITSGGAERVVHARCGVILSSGGFDHDAEMREHYQNGARGADYSSGADSNTGDGIRAGVANGAATDLMDDSWWAPTFMMPDGTPEIVIFERGKPGCLIVDGGGSRFANEALPYNEFVKRMQEAGRAGAQTCPAWFVFDDAYRRRYPVAGVLPGQSMDRLVDRDFVLRAESLGELARQMDMEEASLETTVEHFNRMALAGTDDDFHRGETAFDRFTGDPTVAPNPCLAPLASAPFYAIRLYPGDLGTKGGLLTNEFAQVLEPDGRAIEGLYAAGNCSASAMGHFYPGAGGTIGPAMTFGYIAARHAGGALE